MNVLRNPMWWTSKKSKCSLYQVSQIQNFRSIKVRKFIFLLIKVRKSKFSLH